MAVQSPDAAERYDLDFDASGITGAAAL